MSIFFSELEQKYIEDNKLLNNFNEQFITGTILSSNTGYALYPTTISSTTQLKKYFGYPNEYNYKEWYNAWNYLQYSNNLIIIRPINKLIANTTLKFNGESNPTYSNILNCYNPTIANETIENHTVDTEKIEIINRYISYDQNISILICSSDENWTKEISNELVDNVDNKYTYIKVGNKFKRIAYNSSLQNSFTGELKLFSDLGKIKPNFDNDEFLLLVLQKNDLGIYSLVENFNLSFDESSEIFVDKILNEKSDYIYSKTNVLSGTKPDTFNLSVLDCNFLHNSFTTYNSTPTRDEYIEASNLFSNDQIDVSFLIGYQTVKENGQGGWINSVDEMAKVAETCSDVLAIIGPFDETRYLGKTKDEITDLLIEDFGKNRTSTNVHYFDELNNSSIVFGNMKAQFDGYNNKTKLMPILGDVAGKFASTFYGKAVSGLENGIIKNAEYLLFDPKKENKDKLYNNNINNIIYNQKVKKTYIGSQNISSPNTLADKNANNKKILNYLKNKIKSKLTEINFVGQINSFTTRQKANSITDVILRSAKGYGFISEYNIICDETNNTLETIEEGKLIINISMKPSRFIENVYITITVEFAKG